LVGGNILTMNPSQPRVEAVAVRGDRIARVGTSTEISQLVGKDTKVISLNGKTVVPGFIDTHIHVADFGRLLTWIDLTGARSIKDMQKSLRKRVQKTPKEKWIMGRGWNQNVFAEKRLPTRFDLDVVSPDNPVVFYHQCEKVCVVNTKALKMADVTKQTRSPPDGVIDKDAETGELTGVLRENATNLIWTVVPEPNEEELVEAAGLACERIVAAGVTSVHWMVLSSIEISVIRKLFAQNRLPLRVYMIIPVNLLDNIVGFESNDDSALKVSGAVISADGYLSARTAALFQPYNDDPASRGKLLCTQDEMNGLAVKILKMGLQLVIHAMGDRAVDAALTTIEHASNAVSMKDFRSRIEQAAVLNEALIERIKKQKVVVSVQPRVIASEFSVWSANEHLGPGRARLLFPLKTLLKEGVIVVGGSDCPMEPLGPLLGVQAAVTREFFPEERITVDEALRIYTVDAAYSSGEENVKGSLVEGKLADLVVLSRDPGKVSVNEIGDIAVEMTIVGGKVVCSKR
jgi:predicted amidohydrolase YtcJ